MKKKTIILFAILLVILVGIACFMQYRYTHQSLKSFTATGCTAEGIIVKDSVSYLEVQFDDEKHTAKKIAVKDEEILKKISESNLQEIIGVNIASDIPKNILEDDHLVSNINNFNPLQLLTETDKYDEFFEIADVSFSDEHSFVGKVLEETTTYMIVEPANDEYERTVAEKIKIEYGTDHLDYLYGTGRLVVIYYKGEINTDDGKMTSIKSDDISTEGFREWGMKVVPSNEQISKKIYDKAKPHDGDTTSHWYKQYNLYYHGLEDVIITVDGEQHSLAHALKRGKITMSAILAKANRDVADGVIQDLRYEDGGSAVFKYPDYTIVKYHTLDGNDDMYIGTPDIGIDVKNK